MMDSQGRRLPRARLAEQGERSRGGERADPGQAAVTMPGEAGCGEHAQVVQEHPHIGLAGHGKALHQHPETRFHPESMAPPDPAGS